MSALRVDLRDDEDRAVGLLTLARLPGRTDLLARDPDDDARLVIAEGGTYLFSIAPASQTASVLVEPAEELFSFDDERRLRGRMQPRQYVGRLRVRITDRGSRRFGWAEFDVRPTKLKYDVEYRQMLEDVADVATEALLQGFAPGSLALSVDFEARPDLLYQQFALLHARLSSTELRGAIARVLNAPYVTWTSRVERQPPGRPVPSSFSLSRALTRPGPRGQSHGRLAHATVPLSLERTRTDPSLNSIPNQFVKYALSRWRTVAQHLADNLGATPSEPGPVRRGRDVVAQVLRQLDAYLAHPLFREVGELATFPVSNQVLQKKHGYRQILRTFVLGELGGRLSFDWDLEDTFAASQRNVATLYEYWAFLQLADALGAACGVSRTMDALTSTSDGLSLSFRQGQASAVRWRAKVGGRELEVDLYFNRTFLVSAQPRDESSWSRGMRPDASVRVRPLSKVPELPAQGDLDLWLHFDAKYRLEAARDQFALASSNDGEHALRHELLERTATTKREDLLKMHAYRDAIRRSAGAYVLYPGDDRSPPFREFAEVLPGLGAFVLRPGSAGVAQGRSELTSFLEAVLVHAGERASQHERDRYWRARIYAAPRATEGKASELPDLEAPPDDTLVLCGYLRGKRHEEWVRRVGIYNVRAGERRGALSPEASELQADWLLLYSDAEPRSLWIRDGSWFVQTREQLIDLSYPNPGGPVYLCAPVVEHAALPSWLSEVRVDQLATSADRSTRAPFAVSWGTIVGS